MASEPFELDKSVSAKLRDELPAIAVATASAVIDEVPGYSALRGPAGATLDQAVELALRGFLSVASGSSSEDPASPLQPALDGAYSLGRGEFRSGRTMDVLLSAYRIGARAAWQEWSVVAIDAGLSAYTLARFAELIFSYIDSLSAASVAGFEYELAAQDQSVQQRLESLTRRLLAGGPIDSLRADADRANWDPPTALTAVLLPASKTQGIRNLVDARSLQLLGDLPGMEGEDLLLLLVPTEREADRTRLKGTLTGRGAVLGPSRPWSEVADSYDRALRVSRLKRDGANDDLVDADDHLAALIVGSDPEASRDLRLQVLSPLEPLRPSTSEKLTETLRAWLLFHGSREKMAEHLHVHPQTIRYRMGQLREIYNEKLEEPDFVVAATISLFGEVQPRAELQPESVQRLGRVTPR